MANIYVIINREVEKGNTLVDKAGNFISPEKVEGMARKSYVADLKAGAISFEKTFMEYHSEIIEQGYIPASVIESYIQTVLEYGHIDTDNVMPDPVEPEMVAN